MAERSGPRPPRPNYPGEVGTPGKDLNFQNLWTPTVPSVTLDTMAGRLRQTITERIISAELLNRSIEIMRTRLHDRGLLENGVDQQALEAALRSQVQRLFGLLSSDLVETFGPTFDRLEEGTERILALVRASTQLQPGPAEDTLRAAAVLLHAHLEEFLRSLASEFLPTGEGRFLKDIPLAGSRPRPEKFHLGELARHRGKTVDALLRESVLQHLEQSSYNNVKEITCLLQSLGLTSADYEPNFPQIAQLIERRHQIVHRLDKVKAAGGAENALQSIQPSDLARWIGAVMSFAGSVICNAFVNKYAAETVRKFCEVSPENEPAASPSQTAPRT